MYSIQKEKYYILKKVHKSKRVPKKRLLDGALDYGAEDDNEIRFLEKVKTSKISANHRARFEDEEGGSRKQQKILRVLKRNVDGLNDEEDVCAGVHGSPRNNSKPCRFREAEDDCTEALNLDDRYIKAYSRRATARKELGKLKESIEDSGFALKLEPAKNQEIKKQHAEVKSLYEKEILQKVSGTLRSSLQGAQKGGRTGVSASKKDNTKENDGDYLVKKSVYVKELRNKGTGAGSKSDGQVGNDSPANATPNSNVESVQKNNRTRR
ncbi:hypothetical protein OIU76_003133 [Salix suchowensis]|nr:hypothetical protein OIU76_003133 [Salix suchowensis]